MTKNTKVKVINIEGLDNNTIELIETTMNFNKYYEEDETIFVELENSNGEIIRIFPERIKQLNK